MEREEAKEAILAMCDELTPERALGLLAGVMAVQLLRVEEVQRRQVMFLKVADFLSAVPGLGIEVRMKPAGQEPLQ
jgi:hypothetical protein